MTDTPKKGATFDFPVKIYYAQRECSCCRQVAEIKEDIRLLKKNCSIWTRKKTKKWVQKRRREIENIEKNIKDNSVPININIR